MWLSPSPETLAQMKESPGVQYLNTPLKELQTVFRLHSVDVQSQAGWSTGAQITEKDHLVSLATVLPFSRESYHEPCLLRLSRMNWFLLIPGVCLYLSKNKWPCLWKLLSLSPAYPYTVGMLSCINGSSFSLQSPQPFSILFPLLAPCLASGSRFHWQKTDRWQAHHPKTGCDGAVKLFLGWADPRVRIRTASIRLSAYAVSQSLPFCYYSFVSSTKSLLSWRHSFTLHLRVH